MKIIDLLRRKKLKEEAQEKAEDFLTMMMFKANSKELNEYILQSDMVKKTADVFYETEIAKERRNQEEE